MQPITNYLKKFNCSNSVNLETLGSLVLHEPTFVRLSEDQFQLLIPPFSVYTLEEVEIIKIPSIKIGLAALLIHVRNENIQGIAFTTKF